MRKTCLAIILAVLPIQGWGQQPQQPAASDFLLNAVYCWGAAWQAVENARAGVDANCREGATMEQIAGCGDWGATEARATRTLLPLQRYIDSTLHGVTQTEANAYSAGKSDEIIVAQGASASLVTTAMRRIAACQTIGSIMP